MNRFKASGLHFVGSAAAMFLVFALVRWVWYPGPLFVAANGLNLLGILIPVDAILGPLITLIIFNPTKKGIKLDMAIIFTVQVVFMVYGLYAISAARPAFIALSNGQFFTVTNNAIEDADLKKAKDARYQSVPWLGPEFVGVRKADNKQLQEELAFASALTHMGIQNMPQYFVPYEKVLQEAQAAGKPAEKLVGVSKEDRERLQNYEKEQQKLGKTVSFVLMYAKTKTQYVALDATTGKVIEIL